MYTTSNMKELELAKTVGNYQETYHCVDFTDAAEYWMFPYESPNLQQDIEEVWEMIRPLYEELHAYVRRKLRDLYGPEKIGTHAPLPAHILGIGMMFSSFETSG